MPCMQSAEEPVRQGEASEAQGSGWWLLRAEAAAGGEEARGRGQARDWGRRYGLNIDRVLMVEKNVSTTPGHDEETGC